MQSIPFPDKAGSNRRLFVQTPQGAARGIVLAVHGMAEHAERYTEFLDFLAGKGWVAACFHQRGHGPETPPDALGFFGPHDGWNLLIEDVERVRQTLTKAFSHLPFVLFGHSMGSFISRTHVLEVPDGLSAMILSGTGWHPRALCLFGGAVAKMACAAGKARQPAKLLHRLAFSAKNQRFKPTRTAVDWLSRDTRQVDAYAADPLCGFPLTNAAYRDLFAGLDGLTHTNRLAGIRKDLPVLVISGREDPIGAGGKGPEMIARQYRQAGMSRVQLKLYDGARHELLHEVNRADVMADVAVWLDEALPPDGRRKDDV